MKKNILKIMLLLISAALLAAGILTGGVRDVKNKAAMICYECIGIG